MTAQFLENLFSLAGKTAVVVGGTGVLGGSLADGLAQAGAFVVVAGRGADRGQARSWRSMRWNGRACGRYSRP
jgi:NAD(P)-dependent dehydrogenase (short-subunit alcohol dehydrogenase family)